MAPKADISRYNRQTQFHGIGEEGQRRLLSATVLVLGCGGLGSHVAENLARAGVGRLILVDRDVVELSNIHRQGLFDERDAEAKTPKAEAAATRLARINSTIKIETKVLNVNRDNIEELVRAADLVVDGTDNMETRYLLNETCVKRGIPWVYGGVMGATGMIMAIMPGKGPCLSCLFPVAPAPGELPSMAEVGVINTIPAVVGAIQATEAQRILITGEPSAEGMLNIDLWSGDCFRTEASCDPSCPVCSESARKAAKGVESC